MKTQNNLIRVQIALFASTLLVLALPLGAQEAASAARTLSQDVAESSQPQLAQPAYPESKDESRKADIEVVVVATRSEESPYQVPGSTEAVTFNATRKNGAVTLRDTVKYVPGVSVPFAGGANATHTPYSTGGEKSVNVRGLEGNRVAIMTDGIRQADDFTAGVGSGFPSPGRIYFDPAVYSQIEIFKSAASNLYGSGALGGAVATNSVGPIQLLGPSLRGNALAYTANYSSFNNSINNVVRAAVGDGRWAASAVYSYRTGNEAGVKSGKKLNPTDFTSNAVIAKIVRKFESVSLEGTVDYYRLVESVNAVNTQGAMGMGPTMRYDYLESRQDNLRDRRRFSLGANIAPEMAPAIFDTLDVLAYWQDSRAQTVNPQLTRITTPAGTSIRQRVNTLAYDTEIMGINAQAGKRFATGRVSHALQYGADFSYSDIFSTFTRRDNGSAADDPTSMAPADVYRAGAFLSDKISFGERRKFALTPSVRTDYYDASPDNTPAHVAYAGAPAKSFSNWSISPGLSALYKITDDVNVYGLYTMGTRNPSADELYGSFTHSGASMTGGQFRTVSNPDLKNETSNNFEIGVQGNTTHHAFRLAAYYNLYENFIDSMYDTGIIDEDGYELLTSRNLDNVEIYGVEAHWDWRVQKNLIGFEGFRTGLAAAWSEGHQDTDTNGRQPLSSVAPWSVIGYVGYDAPADAWGVRLAGTCTGAKKAGDIAQPELDSYEYDSVGGYFLLDLTAYYRLNHVCRIYAGINNITDRDYVTWSSARATTGIGHAGIPYAQPGINGFLSISASF